MEKSKIGVVGGLGHIGLIQAACLAKLGYQTIAYDNNSDKMNTILQGNLPFYEPGLAELVQETLKSGLLAFTSRSEDLGDSDLVFICVGTPSLPTGEADTSQIYAAVEEVARNRKKHGLVVIKSTVPVGTSRKLTAYLEEHNLSANITMVSNPEFLREGSGVEDFWHPSRIIVGASSEEAAKKVAGLYRPPGIEVLITSWENAELIKYAGNTFLAAKISFINEVAGMCEEVKADIRIVSKGIGLDPRINPHFLEAGAGFSGPCLEKDLKAFINQFQKTGRKAKLLEAVLAVNEGQRSLMVEKLRDQLGPLKGRRIAVLGMAFKAETDDVRDSHSLPIVKQLLALEAELSIHDPWVKSLRQAGLSEDELPGAKWVHSPYEAVQGKDAALFLTAWPEYRALDLERVKASMAYPLIVDGRNIFDPRDMRKLAINYVGVGI